MGDFYKMDPSAWDFGTAQLSLEEEAAYLRVVNAMHKHRAPVPDNDRVLAGMFRVSTRKARALVEALIKAGKLRREGGHLTNDRAEKDLVHRGFVSSSRVETGAKGGRTRAENARKRLETQETAQAIGSTREEKRREEIKEEAYASSKNDGAALINPPATPSEPDPVATHFPDFWEAYPHRGGKKKNRAGAEAAFSKAIKRGASVAQIAAGVEAMRRDPDVIRGYARDPTTWLNQRGWTDEIPENGGQHGKRPDPQHAPRTDAALEQILRLTGFEPAPRGDSGGTGSHGAEIRPLRMGPRPGFAGA